MAYSRKNHSSATKVKAIRKHLLEKVPVSDICEEFGIHPTVFYRWQKTLFENAEASFETLKKGKKRILIEEQKIAALEAKLHRKDEVLSELMEEHVALKKAHGGI